MGDNRFLLVRFGGQGDALFLSPICRTLAERDGWRVHVAINEQGYHLLRGLPFIEKLYVLHREPVMPVLPNAPEHPCDLIEWRGAWLPVESVYPNFQAHAPEYGPFAVANFRFVIESNSMHPWINRGANSTFANTYDVHYAWCGIDPTTVAPHDRRPVYAVLPDERAAMQDVLRNMPRPIYLVQPLASSPARSFFRSRELYNNMVARTRGTVIVWNGQAWETRGAAFPLPVVDGSTPMRMSAALVEQSDLVVSADTCISHVAEACGVLHAVWYSTIPSWTRSRDYEHEVSIDACVPDSRGRPRCACGIIGRDCPRIAREAYERLTDRQRDLLRLLPLEQQAALGLPPAILDTHGMMPQEYFATTPHGLQSEHQATLHAYEADRQRLAYCIASLSDTLWPRIESIMADVENRAAGKVGNNG